MASRPDEDEDDHGDIERPGDDPARESIEDLEDGEEAAVETALTRLPPG